MAYDPYYDDYYDRPERAPRPHRPRMTSNLSGGYLDPAYGGGGLHRSRSQGHGTQPAVHYHNYIDMAQDNYQRAEQDYPPQPPRSPRGRPRDLYYEDPRAYGVPMIPVASHSRSRSRSRNQDDADYVKQKAVDEYRRRKDEEEKEKKEAIERFKIDEANRKKKEKEEQEEAVRKFHEDEEKKKKEKEKVVQEWKAEEQKKKKEKEEEEEAKREYMRKQLAKFGFQNNQIEVMIEDEKNKKGESHFSGDGTLVRMPKQAGFGLHRPVYPKLRRTDIAVETLKYYDLPWEYDHYDSEFIIITRELSERETDVLFEHTRRLRSKELPKQLEGKKKKDSDFQWVRKRSKSRGRSPSGGREKLAEAVLKQGLK